ncbi:MAG: hypothetical protein Unbinned1524contig1000_68 [Prokaryotic dsDNA virus sp.]|nr:MAG: hypothetical protein Unbinned1524contig1000_68 [Prokaryotic dsDNA virus sp.]|tara:strand:+ start:5763 stop:6035 length:273 start_codon:yes stop_codon:yes gene_type:complete
MADEKIFADGFSFKTRENQPDFVVGRLSIKVEDALAFLKERANNGWVNLNINRARSGNFYCELDTWKPNQDTQEKNTPSQPQEVKEDLPF